ncbi:hypothetical protein DFP72DRAFT_854076 [Ephemerocybe angulata]|uniref:Uncharacterized protein n=1 Tax=Ephemerocybe angulata TaxID=980116 RepID=A0A8H6M154_9AGAR|nr:hypothetical protein DFP72DRAFT_854076 [Tulosesus angulatus]
MAEHARHHSTPARGTGFRSGFGAAVGSIGGRGGGPALGMRPLSAGPLGRPQWESGQPPNPYSLPAAEPPSTPVHHGPGPHHQTQSSSSSSHQGLGALSSRSSASSSHQETPPDHTFGSSSYLDGVRQAGQVVPQPIFERELELIKPDLHNHVVMDFGLSEKSQGRLHNFTTIMNKLPGISKELAVPLFYIMGVLLCILDALDARSSGQTTITPEELGTVYKKIEEKLELSTFRMNEMQRTNATATIKAMVFAKGRLEFHNTKDRAMQLFEDEKASRGFLTAFENHANEEELRGVVSSIAHSVLNGFREDLIMSVCRGSKGRAVSLPSAVQTMGKKFLGRSSLVERDHLKKVALLRRLIMENTELHSDKHLKRGPDGELFFQIPRLEPAVLEGFPDEPEHDDLPPKPQGTVGFWAYFQQIIEDDLATFPTEEKTMTGASDIVAMAQSRPRASTVQASGSRQQDTPSVNYNSLTLYDLTEYEPKTSKGSVRGFRLLVVFVPHANALTLSNLLVAHHRLSTACQQKEGIERPSVLVAISQSLPMY